MRVVLFTSEEPLYLPRYLRPVLRSHAESIAAVVLAPPRQPRHEQVLNYLRTFGPGAFPRVGLRFARGKLLDTLSPALQRTATGRYHGVASLACDHGVPVRRAPDTADTAFLEWFREVDPDVALSVICGQRLPAAVLDVPDEAVNVHGSLLPKYRGRATAFWPLYYGDEESGVTAHLMTESFDAGPIVEQRPFPIEPDDSMHDLSLKIAATGGPLAVALLDRYPKGFETRPNLTEPDDYHTLPTPPERREFRRRGNEFL
ncbi:methionyl-tRNA formyltransferase [Halosimplex sp. TS25]|uniref:methionyl-tRNA formyltransferase n=1 Tax=Halosimplex rarum TaxID=3396619 RepID=UPI0039EC3EFB